MSGKGSKRRPSQVPDKDVEKNWDRIFSSPPIEKDHEAVAEDSQSEPEAVERVS